jgi:hypothetical protein
MGARKMSARAGTGDTRTPTPEPELQEGIACVGFAPIVRVDAPRREIELCATSEAVDSHGTIFDYDASKEAFTRWIGNVREMHGRHAVGLRVAVRCDDESRRIYVRIRISRGAQDTWEKVLDGTLRGASIGACGVVWQRQRRRVAGEQRWLQVAMRYDLVELSLVDNPSNPDALGVSFVRDATPDDALLDVLEDVAAIDTREAADVSNHGQPGDIQPGDIQPGDIQPGDGQSTRERLHTAARSVLAGCGCSACVVATTLFDGSTDTVARVAPADQQPMARALAAGLAENAMRIVALDAGVRALAATIEGTLSQISNDVGGLSRRVVILESQPQSGGPVARPMEKTSALAGRGLRESPSASEQYRALESLAGSLRDPQAQVAVAAELIRLRQQGE